LADVFMTTVSATPTDKYKEGLPEYAGVCQAERIAEIVSRRVVDKVREELVPEILAHIQEARTSAFIFKSAKFIDVTRIATAYSNRLYSDVKYPDLTVEPSASGAPKLIVSTKRATK
jgi:hypothetical protein